MQSIEQISMWDVMSSIMSLTLPNELFLLLYHIFVFYFFNYSVAFFFTTHICLTKIAVAIGWKSLKSENMTNMDMKF